MNYTQTSLWVIDSLIQAFFLNKIAKTQAQKNSRIPKLKLKFAPKLKVPELLLIKRSFENSRICSKTQGLFSTDLKKTQATEVMLKKSLT